jgi:methylmalonyl-CoA epimerase
MAEIKRIDHLGIAVKDVAAARAQYEKLLNAKHIRSYTLHEKVGSIKVAYMQIGENVVSLIQSVDEDGFLNKHIEKHGEGMHHLGLEVDDLEEFVRETEEKGFQIPLRDEFSTRSEIVLRPKDSLGVILQVLQWKAGSDATVEDRIKRIVELENIENES